MGTRARELGGLTLGYGVIAAVLCVAASDARIVVLPLIAGFALLCFFAGSKAAPVSRPERDGRHLSLVEGALNGLFFAVGFAILYFTFFAVGRELEATINLGWIATAVLSGFSIGFGSAFLRYESHLERFRSR